jgi:hypothetical protein
MEEGANRFIVRAVCKVYYIPTTLLRVSNPVSCVGYLSLSLLPREREGEREG